MTTAQVRTDGGRVGSPGSEGELRSVAQLRMLHSLGAKLNGLLDPKQIGEAITAELRTIIDYHNCRVFVLQPDGETLVPVAFRGELSAYQGETYGALVTKVGRGLTGHVAESRTSYYSPDANDDPFAITIPGTPDIEESMLGVPLLYGDQLVGVVVLSKLGVDQFDGEDQRLLEVLASHAAVAIENARLLQSERESAAKARESEARKSAMLESALDCIVVIDQESRIVEFNPAAERTFGYAKADVIGRVMAEVLIPPSLRQRHRDGMRRYVETGEGSIIGRLVEMTAMRSDGHEFPVELAITRVDLPGPALFTGSIRDITERKRAEEKIERALRTEREATRRLRDVDDMKNTFLQAVSHDLRTPLASVLGLALTLNRDLGLRQEEKRDLTDRLAANARKLDRILSNLLDLDRLLRGVVEPALEEADVGSLVRKVVAEADFMAGHRIQLDTVSLRVVIDPPKVERVVENLLVNAVKHTPAGTPLWVSVAPCEGGVVIAVEDAGPGVREDLREAIFEPFRQAESQNPSPGAGIGLSLVARFADLHGGRAWVEPREGGGSSFRVFLPHRPPKRFPADRD